MEPIVGQDGQGNGAAPADLIKDATTETFMQDVIDASMTTPVVVDFWAPWCGPCKQLGPVLEKVVREAGGAVKLVKVNIDESPQIAQQLRIQSIPAVFAFSEGRPVDGFAGAVPESQIKEFVGRLSDSAGGQAPSPIAEALEQAKECLSAEDYATAGALFGQILEHEADNLPATAGLARCLVAAGELDKARDLLAGVGEDQRSDAGVSAAFSALDLAERSADVGDLQELERRIEASPADHQARYDLAIALYGAGQKDEAIDALLEIVKRDRNWNDEAARKQLLQFFEAEGPTDPVTVGGRRKLSAILFS